LTFKYAILMTTLNYTALFIPLFFLFLYFETLLIKRSNGKITQTFERSLSNISIGIAERLINLFVAVIFYNFFYWIYSNYALFKIPNNPFVWLLLLLATDFVWYWYHRLGHKINLFWAAHIVHHQSEEFNLTAAARITTLKAFVRYVFWGILPLAGFHPNMVVGILIIHGVYSFFTHTETVKNLNWLEAVFITPSLHGVHHASNEKYLDKNYGDVFVFWDKLFGTFQKEKEKPTYGLTHSLNSYSFLWQHFHYYLEIFEAFKREKKIKGKFKILFGGPAYMDQDIRPFLEKKLRQHKVNQSSELHETFKNYLTIQIVICVTLLTYTTLLFDFLMFREKTFIVLFVLLTLIYCGALLEQRKWIYNLELARIILLLGYFSILLNQVYFFPILLLSFLVMQYLFSLKKKYHKLLLLE